MNVDILLGKTQEHLVPLEGTKFLIHAHMMTDFLKLQKSAKEAGLDLQVISAFRDYARQLKIWNAKASGERTLLDDKEVPLEYAKLSPVEILFASLRWSAIPGCSRHHWGSDIDVYDGNTQAASEVKLVPSESEGNGPAAALHSWLDMQFAQNNSFGFFRPFRNDLGGVSPERWHLSYYPVSRRMIDSYSFSIFRNNLLNSDVMFKEIILERADEIFQRYIMNFDLP